MVSPLGRVTKLHCGAHCASTYLEREGVNDF